MKIIAIITISIIGAFASNAYAVPRCPPLPYGCFINEGDAKCPPAAPRVWLNTIASRGCKYHHAHRAYYGTTTCGCYICENRAKLMGCSASWGG